MLLPNGADNKKAAVQVSHVSGIANTGNNVFRAQIIKIGPSATATIKIVTPKINFNKIFIAKIPPKGRLTNNLFLPC